MVVQMVRTWWRLEFSVGMGAVNQRVVCVEDFPYLMNPVLQLQKRVSSPESFRNSPALALLHVTHGSVTWQADADCSGSWLRSRTPSWRRSGRRGRRVLRHHRPAGSHARGGPFVLVSYKTDTKKKTKTNLFFSYLFFIYVSTFFSSFRQKWNINCVF